MTVRRLAVIAYHSSPLRDPGSGDAGGMTVYVRELAAALARRGIRTDVFTRAAAQDPVVVAVAPGVRVVSIAAGPVGPRPKEELSRYIDDFVAGVRSFGIAQRNAYDLVHSHYWQSGLAGSQLSRGWSVPLVHSHHTLAKVKNRLLAPGDVPEPVGRIRGESAVTEAADVLVASTDEEWQHLACLYGASHDRLKTVHPGVDHAAFTPGSRSEARRALGVEGDVALALCVGRIQPLKGLDLALRGLVQVRDRLPRPVKLLVVGGPSGLRGEAELERLRALTTELELQDQVAFVGPQPRRRLPLFYRAADALVMCSHTESFGFAALEAQACGTPVVATAVGGLGHIVDHGRSGWLVPTRDAEALGDALTRVLDDAEVQADYRAAAVTNATRFSWDRASDAFIELYECLVREPYPEACTC